ncbi:MAG: ABC transporter ATP-binding protein [Planctomycetes bacterium]|nr:ABC transporter ATP-binding protein [Planctomycetota bacterium]
MDSSAAIEVRGLTKRYGSRAVLDGVDFSVAPGEILGYIGPNGAGKSTTVRALLGLLPDFEGAATVAGLDPRRAALEIKRRVGYVAENALLYESLTVAEHLLFVGRMHELDEPLIERRACACLEALELLDRLDTRIASLSKGMRQKVLLTAALLHAPPVLLLDEPMSGLDVHSQILVKELVRQLALSGRAVLFSSHVMDVVERLCTRVAILKDGRVAAYGTFEELSASQAHGTLEGVFASVTGVRDAQARAAAVVEALAR